MEASPLQTTATPAGVRYALAANTANHVSDFNLIAASTTVTQLETSFSAGDLGARFDIIAAYGNWPGAALSPVTPTVSLVIDTNVVPFTDEAVTNILQTSINLTSLLETLSIPIERPTDRGILSGSLRAQLANSGWPDGFDTLLGHTNPPGLDEIIQQWAAIRIRAYPQLLPQPETQPYHLLLVQWANPEDREQWAVIFGEATQVIDLYSLPISYWVEPEIEIEFTPGGWPIPSQPSVF